MADDPQAKSEQDVPLSQRDTRDESNPSTPDYLIVGQVVSVFGLKGELKVNIHTEFPERLQKLEHVVLAPYGYLPPGDVPGASFNPNSLRRPTSSAQQPVAPRPTSRVRPSTAPVTYNIEWTHMHRGQVLLKLEGIDTVEAAEALRGYWVLVPLEQAKKLPRGAYYLYQIVGLEVYTTSGQHIGKVEEVLSAAANDVYIVKGPGVQDQTGELLIPAIKAVVKRIEIKRGRLVIAPPEEWA